MLACADSRVCTYDAATSRALHNAIMAGRRSAPSHSPPGGVSTSTSNGGVTCWYVRKYGWTLSWGCKRSFVI
eukprot:7953570-Pyramimonas_sp.AAC.1